MTRDCPQALGHVERTWASEFAAASLGPAGLAKLRTEARDASNFDGFGGGFDAVVCNGVSMYFYISPCISPHLPTSPQA